MVQKVRHNAELLRSTIQSSRLRLTYYGAHASPSALTGNVSGEKKSDSKRMKSDDWRMNDDGRRTVRRQKGERKSDDRRTNNDDERTVRRQNGGDRRTVRRQKGEEKRRQEDERRRQDDREEAERRRQEDRDDAERRHQEICESQQVINTRLNEFSGRIDGVEQQIDQVGIKVNRIEKDFQNNKEEMERKLEDTKQQVQREILEKIEGLGHQLHRTSIADSGDYSTSPGIPLQNSTLMHAERGQALEILQSIPEEQQNDYDRIIGALEIRYGHKYLRQVYQSQIKSRQQRSNESLQEYEADIERLIHLAYPQAPKEFLEQIGIQTFIDGLVDTEMQQALRLGRHTTISDALIAALEFKAAKEASRSYKTRVRQKNEVLGRCEPVEKIVKCGEVNQAQTNQTRVHEWSSEELKKSQKKDSDLKLIRNWLKNGVRPTWQEVSRYGTTIKGYWAQWSSLCLRDGLLHRKWQSPDGVSTVYQLVLPKARIHQVLEELHSSPSGGHFGVTRTLARVRDRFYWVNCRRDVEEWCKRCDLCSAKKGPKTRSRGKMVQYLSGAPFERVAVDILGPLPVTDRGNKYLMVVMDYFSKWSEAVPLPNQEAETVAEAFIENHESTTYTPSMLTSGREMKLPTDLMLGRPLEETEERSLPEFVEDLRERIDRIHRFAREKLKIHSDKMKQRLDSTSTETAFKPGDAVWLYAQKGQKEKVQSNWEGPYTIIKKINDLVYRIQLSPRSKPKVVHLERLARYTGHNPPDWFVVEDPPPMTEDSVIRDE
ncbi:hypothetical protein NQ318_015264 [Aromia moschata]|uniref:RNA-directed DNA polymerase n=1 Tax=Aromia moschata TaxID=1265417 RepID=A0AAV8YH57_9CUCU|nr:hypothetical protein NQ318_015264 [Aromia moschata]